MLEEEIRTALLNREFDRAQALIGKWGNIVAADLKAATSEADRGEIYQNALSFAEGNIYLANVIRSHIASELQANSASFLYRDTELEQPHWYVKA